METYTTLTRKNDVLEGKARYANGQTILTDGSRTAILKNFTVMGQVQSSRKWVPLTDVTATDGSAVNLGLYVGPDITAAALVAGDVTGVDILIGSDVTVDSANITLENSLTLNTIVGTVINQTTIYNLLRKTGIFATGTREIVTGVY